MNLAMRKLVVKKARERALDGRERWCTHCIDWRMPDRRNRCRECREPFEHAQPIPHAHA